MPGGVLAEGFREVKISRKPVGHKGFRPLVAPRRPSPDLVAPKLHGGSFEGTSLETSFTGGGEGFDTTECPPLSPPQGI